MRVRTSRRTGWPDGLAHPADLAVAALVDHDAQHPGAHHPDRGRRGQAVVELHPLAQPAQGPGARGALHLDQVLLGHPVGGMGQQLGQLPVVGQDQQALGVACRAGPPGRPGARPGTRETTVGRPSGSEAVVTTPGRFVEQVVDEARGGRHRDAVDGDPVRRRGRPAGRARPVAPSTVTRPSAIRSSQTRRLPNPARASTFCRRSPSAAVGLSRASVHSVRRPGRRRVLELDRPRRARAGSPRPAAAGRGESRPSRSKKRSVVP